MFGHAGGLNPLRAGSARADRVGLDLRHVSWDDEEVLRRLYFAVRDPDWATLDPESVTHFGVEPDVGFGWHASFKLPTGDLRVRVEIKLDSGSLVAAMEAWADTTVAYNRIGWCVLLPLSLAGAPVTIGTAEGDFQERLSSLVAPQPLGPTGPEAALGPFNGLAWDAGGFAYRLSFTGDLFELEDQRNWTDASFKVYSTPLALPRPRQLRPGQVLRQTATLQRAERTQAATNPEASPGAPGRTLGPTRLSALLHTATDADLSVLPTLGIEAVRIELHPDEPASVQRTAHRISQARRAGLGYELTLWCDAKPPWNEVRRLLELHRPELLVILPADARSGTPSECTGRELVEMAARELSAVPLAGGTPFNLCELQRHDLAHLTTLTCTLTPTVHASDELSVLETSEALPDVVRTLRARAPGAALALGPFQGRERRTEDPPGLRPGIAGLPEDWLAASVGALIANGVERLCIAEVSDLVRAGAPTGYGSAVKRASSQSVQTVS